MADIAVQITCDVNGEKQRIILDTVNATQINATSSVTSHPIINGDMISDHMYREPIEMSISGKFSLNGGQAIIVSNAGPKLANIQKLFEQIKDEAILCDIAKLTISLEDKGVRFLTRKNMVLTSITWTENINSLGFNFSFTQALTYEIEENKIEIDDDLLPNIDELVASNFTESVLDWNQVDAAVYSKGVEVGFIKQNFLDYLKGLGADGLVAIGVTAAIAVTVALALSTTIPVVGLVVTAVVIFILAAQKSFDASNKRRKFKEEVFKKYEDDRKNQKEVVRFSNFAGNIHKQINELNKKIRCWQIGTNSEHEALVSIDNNYYWFKFFKNNTTKTYRLEVTDTTSEDQQSLGGIADVKSAPTSFDQCSETNCLFRAYETGTYVYLVRVGEDETDLTSYFVVASLVKPDEFTKMLEEIILNAIYR